MKINPFRRIGPFRKISRREVTEKLGRFLMTILSVALGVAFLTGTLALKDTLAKTFNDISSASQEDVLVRGTTLDEDLGEFERDSYRNLVSLDLEEKIADVLGDRGVVLPDFEVNDAYLLDSKGEIVSTSGAPFVVLPYVDSELYATLEEGRWPIGPREVVLEEHSLEKADLKVGDTTKLSLAGSERQVKVVGAYASDTTFFGAVIIFMDRDVLEPIAVNNNMVPNMAIYLKDGVDPDQIVKEIARVIPANNVVLTGDLKRSQEKELIDKSLGFVNTFLLVFVFIAIFVGSFVISNTFAVTVRQRMKQFAMLRAIGSRPRDIFGLVIGQSLLIGILGSLLGIGLGVLLMVIVNMVFTKVGLTIAAPQFSEYIIIAGLVTGILVTIGGAIIAARSAATTDPLEVLRNASGASEKPSKWKNIIGVVALLAGIVFTTVGMTNEDIKLVSVGAVAILIGVLLSSTLFIPPLLKLISPLFDKVAAIPAKLAKGNILRNQVRTASTAGALIIGIALVSAGAALTSSMKYGATSTIDRVIKFDLRATYGGNPLLTRTDEERIKEVDGVQSASGISLIPAQLEHGGQKIDESVAPAPEKFFDFYEYDIDDGDVDAIKNNKIMINLSALSEDEEDKFQIGDKITLSSPFGKKEGEVGALVSGAEKQVAVFIPGEWGDTLGGNNRGFFAVDIMLDDEADIDDLKEDIEELFPEGSGISVVDREELAGMAGQQLDTILYILYALLGISVITAIAGIVNTLALSVLDRVREIGMVQAIGMSKGSVATMIAMESIMLTIFGTLLGLGTGLYLSFSLVKALGSQGLSDFIFPTTSVLMIILAALVVGILAAVVPARKALKLPILQAISNE